MGLTGTGIQIGSATQFDASIRFPRGMASDGTTLLLFDANKGHTLNPTTGVASRIGSLTNFDVGENQLRSACWNGTNFVFYGNSRRRLYTYDPSDGSVTDLTGELSIRGSNTNPDIWGLAFLDGMYWALARNTDALYNISGSELVQVGSANNYGLTGSPDIQAFTSYRGELIAASNGLDQLVQFNKTTGVAIAIANNALPDGSPEALVEHDGTLLMAGSQNDALFRLYDVLWEETIAAIEVDEGGSTTKDLSTVSQDASSFEFAPSNTARSWLSTSGNDIVITNAPDVTADTDYDVVVRAVRDGVNVDKTLAVRVAVIENLPVWLADNQLVGSVTAGEASRSFNIASLVEGETSITDVSGVPSWGSFDGTDLTLTNIPDTDSVQTITIAFNATNADGTTPANFILTWNPLEVVWAANLSETIGPNVTKAIEISALAPNADTVQVTSTLESWMSFDGTELDITDSPELTSDTNYTISFRARRGGQTWVTANFVLTVREAVLPIWVIAGQRVGSVTSGDTRKTFNIAAMVDGETAIEVVRGLPEWGSFDGTTLVLENVPETDSVETHHITFRSTNDDGSVNANFVLTHNPLLVAWAHVSRRMRSLLGGTSAEDIDILSLVPNADTIEVVSGLENFMNFFGRVLEVRNAPRVTEDTQYTIRFRARRGGQDWIEADFVLTVTVSVTFVSASELHKTIASGATLDIDLTEIVENFDELEVVSGLEAWMAYSGGFLQITRAPIVTETTDFIIGLRARRDMGDWKEAEYLLTLRPSTFLPPNSTQLERDFEAALARREVILFDGANRDTRDTNAPARNAWNPDTIAASLLPYLANAMSVDVWDDAWSETIKRQVIKDSYLVHSKKGTVQSIRDLLNSLGFTIAVINEGDVNSWANYSVTLNYTITIAQGQAIITVLEAVAPIRSTLTGLHVQSNTHIWDGSINFDGSFSFGQVIQLI